MTEAAGTALAVATGLAAGGSFGIKVAVRRLHPISTAPACQPPTGAVS